jgi:urease accessory protein
MNGLDSDALRARITDLEIQLQLAKNELRQRETGLAQAFARLTPTPGSSIHNLLVLSDSALPLGSFAYSNGLESFLAHHKPLPAGSTALSLFNRFLRLSIQSVAFTNVPYVLAGFRDPALLLELDNDLDASTPCNVARAASIAQGRALLSVWERSLAPTARAQLFENPESVEAIEGFSKVLKLSTLSTSVIGINGHLAPIWGVVSLALGQDLADTAYVFLFNHAKAILSAAVRANVLGPYMAQNVLAGPDLQQLIRKSLENVWDLQPQDAGQVVPSMDLWVGRHEMLYSRIFNS